jgi:uncharacterized protein (DUF427 family)
MVIEGNHYFPESSVKKEFLKPSAIETVCHWKGTANYYTLNVHDKENKDAVWYYAEPSQLAKGIKGRVPFGRALRW